MENVISYDPDLPSADVGTGNVEIVISDAPGPPSEKLVHLRAGEVTAKAYANLGLDVVTLANNHTMDYGSEGLATTIDALNRQGIRTVGAGENVAAARAPRITTAAGRTIGCHLRSAPRVHGNGRQARDVDPCSQLPAETA